MRIEPIKEDKKRYLDLLLLADEQESMIDEYLEDGEMFVLFDPNAVGQCVVADLGDGRFEIKSLSVDPRCQRRGYGRALIDFVLRRYADRCSLMLVGTGDSPLTIPFYEKCGFRVHHRVPNFYTENYDHPIFEAGKQLVDKVYLAQSCGEDQS